MTEVTKCYLSVWTPQNSKSQTDYQGKKGIRNGKLDKIGKHVKQWTDMFESMKYWTQLTTMPKRLSGVWTVLVSHSAYVDVWLGWGSKMSLSISVFFLVLRFSIFHCLLSPFSTLSFKYQILKTVTANPLSLWNFSYSTIFQLLILPYAILIWTEMLSFQRIQGITQNRSWSFHFNNESCILSNLIKNWNSFETVSDVPIYLQWISTSWKALKRTVFLRRINKFTAFWQQHMKLIGFTQANLKPRKTWIFLSDFWI